jgi:hypothetical protein
MLATSYGLRITTALVVLKHPPDRCRDALPWSARQKEVSMLTLKHISAAFIAAALASAIVVDTADARGGRGGGGGRGFGGGGGFHAGGLRAGGSFGGVGLRTASFNRVGFAGNRFANAGSFARVSNPIRRVGWAGNRPGWGWGGGGWGGRWAGNRWGWGGNNWGWGWGAAAVGAGLAYAATSNYCDPYYDSYGDCGYGYGSYGSYGSYAPAFGVGFGGFRPWARPWRAGWGWGW